MPDGPDRITELRDENALLRTDLDEVRRQNRELESDLNAILSSIGWKAIQRYRTWLWRQQRMRPRFFRTFDRIATRLLSRPGPVDETPRLKETSYREWMEENEPGPEQLRQQRTASANWARRPLFSVVLPVYRVSTQTLTECVQSVLDQTYEHWELCIAYGYPKDQANLRLVNSFAEHDKRIRVTVSDRELGISANTNAALAISQGDYVAFLDHDDTLAPFALYEAALVANNRPEAGLIYSDYDHIEEDSSGRFQPLFKPDWSPEIMLSANYLTHLTIVSRNLMNEVGEFDPATDGAQDWDLFLRVAEKAKAIEHIPRVLYHWRVHAGSTALRVDAKPYAQQAQLLAVSRHMERVGMPASSERLADGLLHVRFHSPSNALVSIVIPTRDKADLLAKCVASILRQTVYPSYEIVIVDTGSFEPETRRYYTSLQSEDKVRVIDYPGKFNYSAVNNFGAREARGDLLLFLNNDTEIVQPSWMQELASWALYEPIGIVGAKLLYPTGTIQHAGVVVGLGGFADHPFAGMPPVTFGPYGSTCWYRNYLAVTGACMMMRRKIFDSLGGFDESFALCGGDVEICLRARERGHRVVYNPFAEVVHHERATRGDNIPADDFLASFRHYRNYLENGDPYWNPNLSLWNRKIALRFRDEQTSLHFVESHLKSLNPSSFVRPPGVRRPVAESEKLVCQFDFSEQEIEQARHDSRAVTGYRKVGSVDWLIPAFSHAFYGGIFTILRFARHWQSERGVRNRFVICGAADPAVMLSRIRQVLPDCEKSDVVVLPQIRDVKDLPGSDACISTFWATAYFALRYRKSVRRFYFIQDYEPAFFPAGSKSALVENTYRMSYYAIANTRSLRQFYEDEFGGIATHFTPRVDIDVFHPPESPRPEQPWQVCCYGRPSFDRNAFEIVAEALRQLKSRLGSKVHIVMAGENWSEIEHGLEGVVTNLGVLPYGTTADLYRRSHVGVVQMLTRHPSYIPLELMASECLVVTNRNHWTEWLLEHERTCLLSHAAVTSLADTIERGLTDAVLRTQITRTALEMVRERYHDWKPEMDAVYEFLCDPDRRAPA